MRLWRPDLKVWRGLMKPLLSVVRLTVGRLSKDYIIASALFAKHVAKIAKHSGIRGVALYLKVAHVLLMQGLPGSQMHPSDREIGKVTVAKSRDGLPRLIPRQHRRRIRSGDRTIIRLWLTLLGLYRALWFKYPVNLKAQLEKNITRPGIVFSESAYQEWFQFCRKFLSAVPSRSYGSRDLRGRDPCELKPVPLPLTSSGSASVRVNVTEAGEDPRIPGKESYVTSSFESRGRSAHAWISGRWGDLLWDFLSAMGQVNTTRSFWTLMEEEAAVTPNPVRGHSAESGRLSIKLEPAGKVRVFAIVDYWTQCALKPLHDWLMDILGGIPTDGAFDQHRPVKRLLRMTESKKDVTFYSFDLSAATDRFPVELQRALLEVMFGYTFAYWWQELLVGRAYKAPLKSVPGKGPIMMKYSVGQPMGALSSWATFSLSHHVLVQLAASRAGHTGFFQLYALLGDDLVIADEAVAKQYQALCAVFGVEIGLAKSMISKNRSLEFAKVVYFAGEPVLAFPWTLWSVSQSSLSACIAAVQRVSFSGVTTSIANIALAFGARWKASQRTGARWESIPTRLRALLVILQHPDARTAISRPNWIDWLASTGPSLKVAFTAAEQLFIAGWCQALIEVLKPIRERVDNVASEFYWGVGQSLKGADKFRIHGGLYLPSPVERLIEVAVNKAITAFDTSWEKAEASMKHLQKLGIRLRADQASHILKQVMGVIEERADQIGLFRGQLVKTRDADDKSNVKQPLSSVYALWLGWRARALKGITLTQAALLNEKAKVIPKEIPEEESSDEEEGWYSD